MVYDEYKIFYIKYLFQIKNEYNELISFKVQSITLRLSIKEV